MSEPSMNEVICDACNSGTLKPYQLNFEEAVFLCTNKKCLGPLNEPEFADYIVKRKLLDIDKELKLPKKKKKLDSPATNKKFCAVEDDFLDCLLAENNLVHQTPFQNECDTIEEDFLDKLLTEHNVADPAYDVGDIFKDDIFATETCEKAPLPAPKELGSCKKFPCSNARQLFPKSGENIPCTEMQDTSIGNTPQATPPVKDCSLRKRILQPEKKTHSKEKPIQKTSKNNKLPNKSWRCTNRHVMAALANSANRSDFIEALMSMLLHNQFLFKLKLRKHGPLQRLQELYRRPIASNEHASNIDHVKREFLSLLNRRDSDWKGQLSPVHALLEVVKSDCLKDTFLCRFRWQVLCSQCGKVTSDLGENTVLMFTKVPEDFTMTKACCLVPCPSCGADNQMKIILFYTIPEVLAAHFANGLPHNSIASFDFVHNAHSYQVTQVIQQGDDNKFFAWSRNVNDDSWGRHDSVLSEPVYQVSLDIKASDYHMVIWEKHDPGKARKSEPLRVGSGTPIFGRSLVNVISIPSSRASDRLQNEKTCAMQFFSARLDETISKERNRTCSKSEVAGAFPSWPGESGQSSEKSWNGSVLFQNHNSHIEDSMPSPSSSEVSNASDGDVAIVNSSYAASLRGDQSTGSNGLTGYHWNDKGLVEHQKKWTMWKVQAQNQQKKVPKQRVPGIKKKELTTNISSPTKTGKNPRLPSKRNLLDGIVFLQ